MSRKRTIEDKARGLTDADVRDSCAYRHCIHFTGVRDDKCKAGVRYDSLPGYQSRSLDCITRNGCACPDSSFRTFEDAKAEEGRRVAGVMHSLKGFVAVAEASAKNPTGTVACPMCGAGTIHYATAPNGHRRARCSTLGCLVFIE